MKVNAPKKIYLNPLLMEDWESIVRRCTFERQRDSQVEYTRTDAFIEKASEWLNDKIEDYISSDGEWNVDFKIIEDFENYMKGE